MYSSSILELASREYGAGEPLVIVHGLLGSKENWHTIAAELSTDHHVVVPDLRNHGDSPHASKMDFEDMAADLRGLIESLGKTPAHLMGHSLGVKVILQVAMQWPELVGKMVLVDMAAREYHPRHTAILEALLSVRSGVFRKRSEVDAALSEKVTNPQVRALLLKGMKRGEDGTLQWRMNVGAIADNYLTLGRRIDLYLQPDREVILLSGAKSDYVDREDIDTLRGYFPRLQTHVFEQAGHWVHSDARDEFIDVVRWFLRGGA
ncbi:MAG: alpha/beta fold hydrolase [Chitinispirillaceae bacterium]